MLLAVVFDMECQFELCASHFATDLLLFLVNRRDIFGMSPIHYVSLWVE